MKTLILIGMLFIGTQFSWARLIKNWSYQELLDASDLVVIATPMSTSDAGERGDMPNGPKWKVVGVSTKLDVKLVLKGDTSLKRCTLHHYRQEKPEEILDDGPNFVSFTGKEHRKYLLFLKKEADGRYAPASGQLDPALVSISTLDGVAN